jgi:predicted ATPase
MPVEGEGAGLMLYQLQDLTPRSTPLTRQPGRLLSRYVGRDGELATLQRHLAQVERGQGQVVGIIGEPGMGKSRLLYEFRRTVKSHEVTYLEGHCQSYGRTIPYLPILDGLRDACGITEADHADDLPAKVRVSLQELELEPDAVAPYLLHLLGVANGTERLAGLSPQALKARTFEALHGVFLASARHRPLILVVENIHWIDATSEEYLAAFVERLPGAAVLLLVTTRPGYRPPWLDKSYAAQLALRPLPEYDSRQLLRSALRRMRLATPLLQQIVATAEGNPFFLEELAHTAVGWGAEATGLTIPDTIQDVLAARLDRLPATGKRLLQAAAVIGREVPAALLGAVMERSQEDLHRELAPLQAAEFLYEVGLGPERVYTFKHALTQEVAYGSLLRRTRQQYHRRVAEALEAQFPQTREAQPERLAHHYTEAGRLAQALPYWLQAGQRAIERSANAEAIAHLTKGLELLTTLPDSPERRQQELTLHIALGPPLIVTKGYASPEVEHAYTRARELCQQVGETPQRFSVLLGLWAFYFVRAELDIAQELAEQLLSLARGQPNPALLIEAHSAFGHTVFYRGEFPLSGEHAEQVLALYDPQQHRANRVRYGQDPKVLGLSYMAWALMLLGYPDQAVQRSHEALTLAQELSHPFTQAFASDFAARVYQLRREGQRAQMPAMACMALATEHGFTHRLASATTMWGWTLAQQGQGEEGLLQLRQGLAAYGATGAALARPYWLALLAETYGDMGRAEEGLSVVAEALEAVERTGERFYAAELYRLKGELLLTLPPALARSSPEACFQQALDVARRLGTKFLELRAAMSLSRLWQRQRKKKAARQLLAEIYGWFTEGFDTVDLQEARALLDALA